MKKIFLFSFLFLILSCCYAQYPSQNITLYANWDDPNAQQRENTGTQYSSVWGYYDPVKKKEYAIVGGSAGTYFIEVTDPYHPIVRDYVAGRRDSCVWREYKNYGQYLYMVSDDSKPNSIQIADMSYLPDSVHVVYDSDTIFVRAHTVFVDGDKLYLGGPTNDTTLYPMAVFSLVNPMVPVLLRTLDQDYPYPFFPVWYVHDMFVRNDTIYASCGNEGLYIFKFNSNNTFTALQSLTSYPGQGYNHSSTLTPDGKTLVFCDEYPPNLPVKTLDVSDLNNLTILKTFKSNEGATGHNPYIYGNNRVVISYYQDGVQIFNISDPNNPIRTGYFDTRPEYGLNNGYPSPTYQGCWGAYPYLPSGTLLAMDMQNGLFILNADSALKDPIIITSDSLNIGLNPSKDDFYISIKLKSSRELTCQLFNTAGSIIMEITKKFPTGVSELNIQTKTLPAGIYILTIKGDEVSFREKLIKIN